MHTTHTTQNIQVLDIIFSRPALGIRERDVVKYIGKPLKNDIMKNTSLYESDF